MKIISITFILLFTISCSQNEKSNAAEKSDQQTDQHDHNTVYACPMECEGDKTYEEEGACPVCGMDLEEVKIEL